MTNIKKLVSVRPWVGGPGHKFIGPSLEDLLLAYYITQGEKPSEAKKFAEKHVDALAILS